MDSSQKSQCEESCAICLNDTITNRSVLGCNHVFCFDCLVQWCRTKLQCPVCRTAFTTFKYNFRSPTDHDVYTPEPPGPDPANGSHALQITYLPPNGRSVTITVGVEEGLSMLFGGPDDDESDDASGEESTDEFEEFEDLLEDLTRVWQLLFVERRND